MGVYSIEIQGLSAQKLEFSKGKDFATFDNFQVLEKDDTLHFQPFLGEWVTVETSIGKTEVLPDSIREVGGLSVLRIS